MNKKEIKLYNVIFPLWILWLFPQTWIFVLPANFLIDLLVVMLSMHFLKVKEIKKNVKRVILKIWLCGFIADFVGTFAMAAVNFLPVREDTTFGIWWHRRFIGPTSYDPFATVESFLFVTACVVLTAAVIYFLNTKFCLKKADLTEVQRKKTALCLAVFTAPYLFYIPLRWWYWI